MVVVVDGWVVMIPVAVARADVQYALPYAIMALATEVPQVPFEQSRIPYPKLTLLHKQEGSGVEHPRFEY